MMAFTAGCGDTANTEPTAAPPVQPPGITPGKLLSNKNRERAQEQRAALKIK
jgi:hypothetical protein